MSTRRVRGLTGVVALVVLVAACGGNGRSSDTSPTTGAAGSTATTAQPSGPTFGDAALPCGPAPAGQTNTGGEKGVTADTITIGSGDDRGFSQAPGLNKEMTEAVQDLVKVCNDAGGINGRKLQLKTYDAAILQIQQAWTKACGDNLFFMVGEGMALDSNQEEIRLGCKTPAVPGNPVSAAFAGAPLMIQPVPNPANVLVGEGAVQVAKLQPE